MSKYKHFLGKHTPGPPERLTSSAIGSASSPGSLLWQLSCLLHNILTALNKGKYTVFTNNGSSPNICIQILQTDLYTLPYRISWYYLIKNQSIFPLAIIFSLIPITFSLSCALIMWGLQGKNVETSLQSNKDTRHHLHRSHNLTRKMSQLH